MTHQSVVSTDSQSPSHPDFYSPADLVKLLGVSIRTVRSWIRSGDLAHFRLGPGNRLIRVRHEDLEEFLNRRYRKSYHETGQQQ